MLITAEELIQKRKRLMGKKKVAPNNLVMKVRDEVVEAPDLITIDQLGFLLKALLCTNSLPIQQIPHHGSYNKIEKPYLDQESVEEWQALIK